MISAAISSIAAGQNTTLFLVKPGDKVSDLPRHPEDVQPPPACVKCKKDIGDPLECDKVRPFPTLFSSLVIPNAVLIYQCDAPWHLGCLNPPLSEIPEGEWFCPTCTAEGPGAPVGAYWKKLKKPRLGVHKAPPPPPQVQDDYDDDDFDESEESDVGTKRKASGGRGSGAFFSLS